MDALCSDWIGSVSRLLLIASSFEGSIMAGSLLNFDLLVLEEGCGLSGLILEELLDILFFYSHQQVIISSKQLQKSRA